MSSNSCAGSSAAMLFRATQEQMIGAALAGLSWSQASRLSGALGIGQRDALIRPAVIRTIGVWPLLPWRAGQVSKAIHVIQAREIAG
jgi:hypothetical protein